MKKQTITAVILSMLLTILLAQALSVNLATANPLLPGGKCQKSVYENYSLISPQNTTYHSSSVSFALTVNTNFYAPSYMYFYILDGKGSMRVDDARVDLKPVRVTSRTVESPTYFTYTDYTLEFSVTLSNLAGGSHNIIFGNAPPAGTSWTNPYISELTPNVYFSVETSPPRVSILSPKNETYDAASIPLNFILYEEVSWVGYSLDGKGNVSVDADALSGHFLNGNLLFWEGSLTLSGLSAGVHSLTVYAGDFDGSIGTSSCIFTIGQEAGSTQEQQSLVPSLVAGSAIAITVAVGAVGLLFYFKKRKR